MCVLEIIGLLIILVIALALGGFTLVAVVLVDYVLPAILIFILCVGIFTWIKIGYKKIKSYLHKKKNYPKGKYKI